MSVSVFVMPLSTWLSGRFRPSWGPDGEGGEAAGPQRSPEDVRRGLEALEACVERALGKRPEWDESGPARLAMVFSVDGFFAPFLEARRRSYRQKLPLLSTLEPPQIWIPQEFDVALPFPAPWNPPADWTVASAPRLQVELRRLLGAIEEDERPDLEETRRVGTRLLEMAALGVTHAVPVIIEV